jgi:outer membrane protein OmpA-like peptidoglycan-associated protein
MNLDAILRTSRGSSAHLQEEHWIPLSDLMTGLMMVFMLIAIMFMVKVEDSAKIETARAVVATVDANNIKGIASIYNLTKEELYRDLHNEFKDNFVNWNASLDQDLSIRFSEKPFPAPRILFASESSELPDPFKRILDDFFPRYVKILSSEKYKNIIEEIRIEGHTSSQWKEAKTAKDAYFLNMALSQARTRATLQYLLDLPKVADQEEWLRANVTANGLSSSKVRRKDDGSEDKEGSQRVEFRVRTNADAQIANILKAGGK